MARKQTRITKEHYNQLWNEGLSDKTIAKKLGCSYDVAKRIRQGYGYEANSSTSGALGKRVSDFIELYRDIILEGDENSSKMIHLCENCSLPDCYDCISIARKRTYQAA